MSKNKPLEKIKAFLDKKVSAYNQPDFIPDDPITIPHQFSRKPDIEIAGFFAATFAWGQRKTIISKCRDLLDRMDNAPYDFIKNHREIDLKSFESFKHRTFNGTDLLYFIHFLNKHYSISASLEDAFLKAGDDMKDRLSAFHRYFFDDEFAPERTQKHVATPVRNSSCKRLNMFLRWMVRTDNQGVDFGIWKRITPGQLICPLDVHVGRTARKLGILSRKQDDWLAAAELTDELVKMDATDPVKYDFALFGLGVMEKF